jgi:CRISPR system Cascade subunit CasE
MELDTSRRNTMKALVSPNLLHGAIEAAFPGERTRKLWRIDKLRDHCYLLLLSDRKPELRRAAEQFGIANADQLWETKDYGKLLDRIEEDSVWYFRITANPTKCCKDENGERGTVKAHITPFYQKMWLLERGEKCGFHVNEDSFNVIESSWKRFYKGTERKKPVTILAVTYEGILKVTNTEKFQKTLTDGLGRGKAFGMGMLTIVKEKGLKNE